MSQLLASYAVSQLSPSFPQEMLAGDEFTYGNETTSYPGFRSEYEGKPVYEAFAKLPVCQNMSGQLSAWFDILSGTCRKL